MRATERATLHVRAEVGLSGLRTPTTLLSPRRGSQLQWFVGEDEDWQRSAMRRDTGWSEHVRCSAVLADSRGRRRSGCCVAWRVWRDEVSLEGG